MYFSQSSSFVTPFGLTVMTSIEENVLAPFGGGVFEGF